MSNQQMNKLMPNLDKQSTQILNLTVLQRIDPFVEEILITAAHVTFYQFNIELNQWSRKDVEGSLFVVKRNTQPRFQFIVMNRRNTENLVENILGDFEYEIQVPYLLYRNAVQEVNGIWFYNARECEDVANLFSRILNAFSKVPPKPKVSTNKSEFEELEAVPTMDIMEGPLEPTSSTTSAVADVPEDISFINFFSAAMNLGNTHIQAPSMAPLSSSHKPSVHPLPLPLQQKKPSSLPNLSTPMPVKDSPDLSTNLVKPSYFVPPQVSPSLPSSSMPPSAPPLHPPVNLQRPHGSPMLQPFPPPTPSPSLAPNYVLSKDRVREALARVLQKDQFIEMFYQELLNAHHYS